MSSIASGLQGLLQAQPTRSSSTPRLEMFRYVSPTYKSTVFSHLREDTDLSTTIQNSRTGQSFQQSVDESKPTLRRGYSLTKHNHALPTVAEWSPQKHHINDPDFYEKIERDALAESAKRTEQAKVELKLKKEKLNDEYKDVQKSLDKKFQSRLDHKKPSEENLQVFKESEDEFLTQLYKKQGQAIAEKIGYWKFLAQQKEEKNRQKQLEIEEQRQYLRTGLELKPRREYDLEEYKRVLKIQIEEKQQRKRSLVQSKQEEQQERLKDLQEQELTMENYMRNRQKKTQSVDFRVARHNVSKDFDANKSTEDTDILEVSHNKQENAARRSSTEFFGSKRGSFTKLNNFRNDGENAELSKRKSLDLTSSVLRNASSTKNYQGSEKISDWELASQALLKKKEQQEEYLKDLKSQIMARKVNKEAEKFKNKQDEKMITGLKLPTYKPKESILQVSSILKKQIAEKEDTRQSEKNAKKEQTMQLRETQKKEESTLQRQYESFVQQKMQMLARVKKEISDNSRNKKQKGLTTVKI